MSFLPARGLRLPVRRSPPFVCGAAFLLALGLLAGCAPTSQAPQPFSVIKGKFNFHGWGGPPIPVWYTTPPDLNRDTQVLIVMHGARRDADNYRDQWHALARRYGFLLLVPEFSKDAFPKDAYTVGNVFDKAGRRNPEEQWAFSAIDPLFDHVRSMLDLSRERYDLYGHSGGSQFVHRFLYFKPQAKVARAIAANAGWYTMPDYDVAYPYGLKDSGVDRRHLAALLGRRVLVLLGDRDINPNHRSLRRTPEALRQGPHRFARGHAFFELAERTAREYGVPFRWRKTLVQGADHNNALMAPAAAASLFSAR